MNNKISFLLSKFKRVAGLAVLMLAIPLASVAQETTSEIRGKVYDESGAPLVGAYVRVEDLRTGIDHAYTTNNSGVFLAARLPAGGPYQVTVNDTKTVEVPSIALGDVFNLIINMQTAIEIEEIITIGQTAEVVDVAAGPAATFSTFVLDTAVAFDRDITDVYGVDPRVNIDHDGRGVQVNCMGMHPRFNSITLDGVSQNDRFGLNSNGYSTATGMPFPYDALEQIAVELAPIDVTYGGFSACNVNAVTKSGTNTWTGNAFYDWSNQDFRGDKVLDQDLESVPYTKDKYGFTVGGPIIKDKLFVFGAYEKSEEPLFQAMGFAGSGNGVERPWLSQADFDRIVAIANNVYGYDPGGQPSGGARTNEKYMVRLDWNINQDHNATFIYNFFDGAQANASDNDSDEFEFSNHFYTKGAESETFTLKLASQWTDALSTELFFSTNTMDDSQITVGPGDFGDFQIAVNGRDGTVYVGADDSRQANSLGTESTFVKIQAQYLIGDHVLTGGYEREDLEIFNIFVQHSRGGEWDFFDSAGSNPASCDALDAAGRWADPTCGLSGIDKFELGRPDTIYYGSAGGTNVANDAAAQFSNVMNAVFIQDEIYFDNIDLTIIAGLRYEFFESSDQPTFNPAFSQANGFRNDVGIDGLDLLMPRLGFTWGVTDDVTLRGGVGLFGGGNPNVWLSNAWSNDGVTNVQTRDNNDPLATVLDPTCVEADTDCIVLVDPSSPGRGPTQGLFDQVSVALTPRCLDGSDPVAGCDDGQEAVFGNTSRLNAIDSTYEQPGIWKFSLGATWDMPWGGITADIDYMHMKQQDPQQYIDVSQEIVGQTIIGLPRYDFVNGTDNLVLLNSTFEGTSDIFSIGLSKDFDFGLDVSVGYAYTESEDVSPMTSFTAGSSFENLATSDVNNPSEGPSNYVVPHRFTFRVSYGVDLFGDLRTRFTAYGTHAEGQAQTYVMAMPGDLEGDGFFGRHPLYVPDGPSDPNVDLSGMPQAEQDAFFAWIASEGLPSGVVGRNSKHAPWSNRIDIRIDQELPTFIPGTSGRLGFRLFNLGNFLSSDWGTFEDAEFFSPEVIRGSIDTATGQYVYDEFSDRSVVDLREQRSLWEARLTFDLFFGE